MKVVNAVGSETRLGDLIRTVRDVIRRRILVLLAVAAAVAAVGILLTLRITPVYQGVTRVQIDPTRNPLARSAGEAQAQLGSEAIETEVSVIRSLDVARAVVRRLNLVNNPEFIGALAEPQLALSPEAKLEAVAQAVNRQLDVARDRLTYIINIRFNSQSPDTAAQVANSYAVAYLDTKVGNKIGTAERQALWFQNRMDELAGEIRAADERVAQYQAQTGIVRGASSQMGTIVDQQVAPLSLQLASAESFAAEARAKEQSARQQVRRGALDAVSDVRQSATIQDLRRQRAALSQTEEDVRGRYGERHPDYIKVRDQVAAIDAQMREEMNRVVRSLDADAGAAEARAASLRASMSQLEQRQGSNARASVIAASLQREAEGKHAAYDKMAQAALEARQAAQNSIAQAQIIDSAEPPQDPSWPNRPLLFLLSILAGLGVGTAVIVTQEMMASGFRSIEEIEGDLDVPLIAAVPNLRQARPADIVIDKPTSQYAEALRNARASLLGVRGEARPKVIALTSALPSEGKTTTALGLARVMAMNGDRTIIVDADVRRAQLRTLVQTDLSRPGLVELLHGDVALDDAIEASGLAGLDQIVVNKPYFSSENLFGNDLMPQLLQQLSERYDTIILDLPPLVGLADGRFLAALADAVALVVRWNKTPKDAVTSAASWLKTDGANLVGSIFTMVDVNAQSTGSYYYYSKKYSEYYREA